MNNKRSTQSYLYPVSYPAAKGAGGGARLNSNSPVEYNPEEIYAAGRKKSEDDDWSNVVNYSDLSETDKSVLRATDNLIMSRIAASQANTDALMADAQGTNNGSTSSNSGRSGNGLGYGAAFKDYMKQINLWNEQAYGGGPSRQTEARNRARYLKVKAARKAKKNKTADETLGTTGWASDLVYWQGGAS